MPDTTTPATTVPQEILVLTGYSRLDDSDLELRGEASAGWVPKVEPVDLVQLQGQVNIFLQQVDQILTKTPEQVGKFHLSEFEIAVGIVVEAKGEVKLAWLAKAEVGGSIDASMKFVFKRS